MPRALTICQPYASLIVTGEKRVENRRWQADPRNFGDGLVIHAGKSRDWLDTWEGPMPDSMPFGELIGIVDFLACLHIDRIRAGDLPADLAWVRDHEHTEGPWCWVLGFVRRFDKPRPWRGQPGIFHVPSRVVRECLGVE